MFEYIYYDIPVISLCLYPPITVPAQGEIQTTMSLICDIMLYKVKKLNVI